MRVFTFVLFNRLFWLVCLVGDSASSRCYSGLCLVFVTVSDMLNNFAYGLLFMVQILLLPTVCCFIYVLILHMQYLFLGSILFTACQLQ